jgi:hypothetical protein
MLLFTACISFVPRSRFKYRPAQGTMISCIPFAFILLQLILPGATEPLNPRGSFALNGTMSDQATAP